MESFYGWVVLVLLGVIIYFYIKAMAAYPPSLHFVWQLSEEEQVELDKRIETGTKYHVKMWIFIVMLILLILLYPLIFG